MLKRYISRLAGKGEIEVDEECHSRTCRFPNSQCYSYVSPPTSTIPTNSSQYKPLTSLSGPTDPIPIHPLAQQGAGLDYECELVAIISKPCASVPESRALDHVLGYSIGNDVSHRDWQLKHGGGQWALGKGFDGWAPYGPGIVSPSLIPDPQNLGISTKLNGETVQESNTRDMIFGVAKTIAFLSQGTTLLPGDLIFTGTPQGVGMGRNPQVWLRDGDVVEVALEGVGTCRNRVEFVKGEKARL
jgi:2-keto-4-pentenoate hydratase/2-oxohepta-3-ene-1,7-dioic acid hydratase in catechol pathway